jgi:hypothetical protein
MTYEEMLKLQPGDKIVLREEKRKKTKGDPGWREAFQTQDENGGYLTFKGMSANNSYIVIEELNPGYWFSCDWVELAKPKSWSYERDY